MLRIPLLSLTGAGDDDAVSNDSADSGTTRSVTFAPQTSDNVQIWTSDSGNSGGAVGDDDDDQPDTFDREYVTQLRRENASYRTRLRKAEAKLTDFEKEKMSDLEKAQQVAKEKEEENVSLRDSLLETRVELAVTRVAATMNFNDPKDALELINFNELDMDEETGQPTERSVKKALKTLVESKPYLVLKTSFGNSDSGAPGGPVVQTYQDRVDYHKKRLAQQGYSET